MGVSVKELRQRSGLSQTDFWKRFGVTQSGGSRYESGRRIPKPVQILMELAQANKDQVRRILNCLRLKNGRSNARGRLP